MNVYKNYSNIMKKRFPTVLIYCSVFILFLLLLNKESKEGTSSNNEQIKMQIGIIQLENEDELTEHFIQYMQQYCEPILLPPKRDQSTDALYYGQLSCLVTIRSGFKEKLLSHTDSALETTILEETWENTYLRHMIDRYLDAFQTCYEDDPNKTVDEILRSMNTMFDTSVKVVEVNEDQDNTWNMKINQNYNLLAYIIWACIITIVCISMQSYRENAVYQRHLVAPLSPIRLNLQLLLGSFVYTIAYTLLLIALAVSFSSEFVLSVQVICYWMNTLVYAISVLTFAFFLSFRVRHITMIHVIANGMAFILASLSGVFFSFDNLSETVKRVASITPMYWFIYGNKLIMMIQNGTWTNWLSFAKVIGIQLLFACTFLSLLLVGIKMDETKE